MTVLTESILSSAKVEKVKEKANKQANSKKPLEELEKAQTLHTDLVMISSIGVVLLDCVKAVDGTPSCWYPRSR